jgi:hypothetical protein
VMCAAYALLNLSVSFRWSRYTLTPYEVMFVQTCVLSAEVLCGMPIKRHFELECTGLGGVLNDNPLSSKGQPAYCL